MMDSSLSHVSLPTLIRLYVIATCYRLFNAYIIQTQFDPDEYWQTLEPAYCLAFSSNHNNNDENNTINNNNHCAYTWEWTRSYDGNELNNNPTSSMAMTSIDTSLFSTMILQALHGPVRSYVSILPTYLFYKVIQYLSYDSSYVISHGPLYLNALLVAAPTDVAIYYIATWIVKNKSIQSNNVPMIAFIVSLTNWFHGYALIRTYSNSLETMLVTIGIALLCPELFGQNYYGESTNVKTKTHHHYYYYFGSNAKIAFVLGGLGVAIRFTSLAAWIPIGLIISCRLTTSFMGLMRNIVSLCALYGGCGLFMGCLIDWYFYGGDSVVIPFLGNFHFNVILGKFGMLEEIDLKSILR